MENMEIYEKVRAVPKEALKTIGGGRLKGMSDINPMWRIKMLTEMFGICGIGWKIEVTDKRLENGAANEIVCFVDILLSVKVDGEWSAPIPGMGGSSFVTLEKGGLYTSDECFKMAYTDAISVACKSLGFAADVYFANDRTKYTDQEDNLKQNSTPAPRQQSYNTDPRNEDLEAIAGASNAQYGNRQQTTPPPTQSTGGSAMARVYKLREQLNMQWGDLNTLAGTVLGREIKYLKNHVKTEDEWKQIEEALKVAV